MDVVPTVLAGATDMRFLRRVILTNKTIVENFKFLLIFQLNIPAFGFSPLINTPILLHDHNEFVHADEYLAGIQLYIKLLSKLGEI